MLAGVTMFLAFGVLIPVGAFMAVGRNIQIHVVRTRQDPVFVHQMVLFLLAGHI